MSARLTRRLAVAALTAVLALAAAPRPTQAQTPAPPFEPRVGQPGKDVVWVPTSQALVEKMLDLASVTPQDYLLDLGSGDGRTVITAAKRGVRALGIEYDHDMVELAKRNAASAGVSDMTTFVEADLFESDFSKAQVITMFLLPSINLRLRPTLLDLTPGTRLVSNTFKMDDWEPDATTTITGCRNFCEAYLWIVPAKVSGTWRLGEGALTLRQTFQRLEGTLGDVPITGGTMRGDQISFIVGTVQYTGRISGSRIEGTTSAGEPWTASR